MYETFLRIGSPPGVSFDPSYEIAHEKGHLGIVLPAANPPNRPRDSRRDCFMILTYRLVLLIGQLSNRGPGLPIPSVSPETRVRIFLKPGG